MITSKQLMIELAARALLFDKQICTVTSQKMTLKRTLLKVEFSQQEINNNKHCHTVDDKAKKKIAAASWYFCCNLCGLFVLDIASPTALSICYYQHRHRHRHRHRHNNNHNHNNGHSHSHSHSHDKKREKKRENHHDKQYFKLFPIIVRKQKQKRRRTCCILRLQNTRHRNHYQRNKKKLKRHCA